MPKMIPGRNGGKIQVAEKGESGNPAGKIPGTKNRSTIAREILETECNIPPNVLKAIRKVFPKLPAITNVESAMSFLQAYRAIIGDKIAAKFGYELLMDSRYGKPKGDENAGIQLPTGAQIIIKLGPEDDKSDPM